MGDNSRGHGGLLGVGRGFTCTAKACSAASAEATLCINVAPCLDTERRCVCLTIEHETISAVWSSSLALLVLIDEICKLRGGFLVTFSLGVLKGPHITKVSFEGLREERRQKKGSKET